LRALRSTFVLAIGLCVSAQAQQAGRKPYTSWPDYGGSPDSMQYSALTQIDRANVGRLQRAWFFPVPDRKAT
jgi:glucose dehydrogenase